MIPALCNLLTVKDSKTLVVILDGIENILKAGHEVDQVDKVACAIEECNGLDKIEKLQNHENDVVYNKAYAIIEKYFSGEEVSVWIL